MLVQIQPSAPTLNKALLVVGAHRVAKVFANQQK